MPIHYDHMSIRYIYEYMSIHYEYIYIYIYHYEYIIINRPARGRGGPPLRGSPWAGDQSILLLLLIE